MLLPRPPRLRPYSAPVGTRRSWPQAAPLPVRGPASRRIHLGLSRVRADYLAGAHREDRQMSSSTNLAELASRRMSEVARLQLGVW